MNPKKSVTPIKKSFWTSKKFWTWILVIGGIVSLGIMYTVDKILNKPWYTEYEGPVMVVPSGGKEYIVPLRTWRMLRQICDEMADNPMTEKTAGPVVKNIEAYAKLLTNEFATARGKRIDFVAMIHTSVQSMHDNDWLASTRQSQAKVTEVLKSGNYGAIGKEGSWSNPLTMDSLLEENLVALRRAGMSPTEEIITKLRGALKHDMQYDGVMTFKEMKPEAKVFGIEDEDIYYLMDRVNSIMRDTSLDLEVRLPYFQYERVLVWFRTEIAVARALHYMREYKADSAVIVMGQNHRHGFMVIADAIGLKNNIIHSVPSKFRSDEAR